MISNLPAAFILLTSVISSQPHRLNESASIVVYTPKLNSTTEKHSINFTSTLGKRFVKPIGRLVNFFQNEENLKFAPITMELTLFKLYRKNNRLGTRFTVGDSGSLKRAHFNPHQRTAIFTHGYGGSRHQKTVNALRRAYLDTSPDVNLIIVDWSICSNLPFVAYLISMQCSIKVGSFIAELIQFLMKQGAKLSDLHLLGHSLGAHAMSRVSNFGIKVPRITGLDPTQVGFWNQPNFRILDKRDADYVDVIHTEVMLLGWDKALGHSDFFATGGEGQPKCSFLDENCNHNLATEYFAQSLRNPERFPAKKCKSVKDANVGNCHGSTAFMGNKSIEGERGIYYVNTKKSLLK